MNFNDNNINMNAVVSLCQSTICQCKNSPTFVLQNSVVTEAELFSTRVGELSHWQFVLWQSETTAFEQYITWLILERPPQLLKNSLWLITFFAKHPSQHFLLIYEYYKFNYQDFDNKADLFSTCIYPWQGYITLHTQYKSGTSSVILM